MMNTNAPNHGGREPRAWGRLILFVLFLMLLAAVLNGMGWCIGGVCDIGTDLLFK